MSEAPTALPAVSLLGIGAVSPLGRDLETIARRLRLPSADGPGEGASDAHIAPMTNASHRGTSAHADPLSEGEQSRRVPDELLADPAIAKRMRRADRFAKMTTLAALDAWENARPHCADVAMDRVGLIVSTGFGPHGRGFKFLDGILDCGDDAALPTDFSHSVHGAAAAYITEILELRGPGLTNTDFENGFAECVQLAQCWLAGGVCDRVLVGAAEELGEVMLHCAERMLPDHPSSPSEGAVFFVMGPSSEAGRALLRSTGCQPVQDHTDQHRLVPDAAECSFGLNASSGAFALLEAILTQRSGVIDNPVTFTPSSTARTGLILDRR